MCEYVTILFSAFGINASALILAFMIHVTEWKEYEKTISRYGVVEFRARWKATMLYHKTKDILYVMRFLGHKSIKNTLIYINLETACHPNGGDDYTTKVAKTEAEICSLIEAGFEYVLQKDDLAYFRKRK